MTTTYNKFEEVLQNKLGEIQNKNNLNYSAHLDTAMANAIPIWTLLGITEEDYNAKYQPTPLPAEPEQAQTPLQDISGRQQNIKNF
jgi:hypothetical protein